MRIGTGFDIHKHKRGIDLFVGTVKIEGPGFIAHSDGDIIVHALIDALLGTVALGDIGDFFPSDDEKWNNASGEELLLIIKDKVYAAGLAIENIDVIVLSNIIHISSVKKEIKNSIAKLLEITPSIISVKGKTTDSYGVVIEEEASASFVTVLGSIN
jgi:2-C-methyl-D-erythritol 2,4-cyclodiphosphate synthase